MRTLDGDHATVPAKLDDDGLRRLRDLMMLAYAAEGLSLRALGKLFNTSKPTVSRRLRAIPPGVREHYLRTGFDGLLPASGNRMSA